MTTVTNHPNQTQQLNRAQRIAAELNRELSGLTGKEQRASLDIVADYSGDCALGNWHGVFFAVEYHRGEPQVIEESVALDDVDDFVAHHGLPATHQRARDLFDLGNCTGGDRAIDDALDGWEPEPDCDDGGDGDYYGSANWGVR